MAHFFQVLNLSNVANWLGEDKFAESDGLVPANMLCVPIFNGLGDVIGIAQLVNKRPQEGKAKGPQRFVESDISLFEAKYRRSGHALWRFEVNLS